MTQLTNEQVVREFYKLYHARDKEGFKALMHPDFQFTSPYDDHIDQKHYFQRCWNVGDTMQRFNIDKIATMNSEVFIHYTVQTKDGGKFKNVEIFNVKDGKVKSVEVYFGDKITEEMIQGTQKAVA